jgi:hypothetical protein
MSTASEPEEWLERLYLDAEFSEDGWYVQSHNTEEDCEAHNFPYLFIGPLDEDSAKELVQWAKYLVDMLKADHAQAARTEEALEFYIDHGNICTCEGNYTCVAHAALASHHTAQED